MKPASGLPRHSASSSSSVGMPYFLWSKGARRQEPAYLKISPTYGLCEYPNSGLRDRDLCYITDEISVTKFGSKKVKGQRVN